jgi:hypothetical protein
MITRMLAALALAAMTATGCAAGVDAEKDSKAAAAASSAKPGKSAAPKPPKTVVYTGSGDKVVRIKKPGGDAAGPVLLYVKGNAARRHMSVEAKDSDGETVDLLVNDLGPVAGIYPVDFEEGQKTSRLVVKATGAWRLELRSILTARKFTEKISGAGPAVVFYTGKAGVASISGNKSKRHFGVKSYTVEGDIDLLVNTIDRYKGEVEIPAETFVVVTAHGPWAIRVSVN